MNTKLVIVGFLAGLLGGIVAPRVSWFADANAAADKSIKTESLTIVDQNGVDRVRIYATRTKTALKFYDWNKRARVTVAELAYENESGNFYNTYLALRDRNNDGNELRAMVKNVDQIEPALYFSSQYYKRAAPRKTIMWKRPDDSDSKAKSLAMLGRPKAAKVTSDQYALLMRRNYEPSYKKGKAQQNWINPRQGDSQVSEFEPPSPTRTSEISAWATDHVKALRSTSKSLYSRGEFSEVESIIEKNCGKNKFCKATVLQVAIMSAVQTK